MGAIDATGQYDMQDRAHCQGCGTGLGGLSGTCPWPDCPNYGCKADGGTRTTPAAPRIPKVRPISHVQAAEMIYKQALGHTTHEGAVQAANSAVFQGLMGPPPLGGRALSGVEALSQLPDSDSYYDKLERAREEQDAIAEHEAAYTQGLMDTELFNLGLRVRRR